MTATLRVMLDQVVGPTDPDLRDASVGLATGLVATAPADCVVEAIAPGGKDASAVDAAVPGLAGVHATALGRRELGGVFTLGMPGGVGGGMIHSPTLFAPLVRHDRVHDNDQTVVTVWDLEPWSPQTALPRSVVAWHRAMLRRAAKHADAVVVPTHAMAQRIVELAPLRDRVRVIAGAAPVGFAVPTDDVGRRRELALPEGFVLLAGGLSPCEGLEAGLRAVVSSGIDVPVVVIGAAEGEEPAIADLAAAAGLPEGRLHVRGALDATDRAAVLAASVALVAPSSRTAFPWRVVEALALGVPVVATSSPVHEEVVVDGGVLVSSDDLGAALAEALGSTATAERLAVLAADRGRVFSWIEAADRVWQLHAEL